MAYIGNTQQNQNYVPAIDYFSGNGSTTAFTLSRPVASVAQVQAVIENVPQNPGDAYTVSGNTITFTSAPPSGTNNIYIYYTSPNTQVVQPGQGTVGTTQMADGVTVNFNDGSAAAPSITNTGDTNTGMFFPAADTIAFAEGGVETMRLDSSGNVGIGTSSPSSALQISRPSGVPWIDVTGGSYNTRLFTNSATTGLSGVFATTNNPLAFGTNDTERMRIDSSGNVGIGTTATNFRLTTNYTAPASFTNASGDFIQMWQATNTNALGVATETTNKVARFVTNNGYVTAFNNASTEAMRITSNGGIAFGGASNFGTSGQVLQSNGDAVPTWVTPASGGVTSLNGQTGAITNTSLYAIGSYVSGRPANGTNYAANSTVAGSILHSAPTASFWNGSFTSSIGATGSDLVNTGTWRCVSRAFGNGDGVSGLWVRIS